MCILFTRVIYSVVITWQYNPPISLFTSTWSIFVYPILIVLSLSLQVHDNGFVSFDDDETRLDYSSGLVASKLSYINQPKLLK